MSSWYQIEATNSSKVSKKWYRNSFEAACRVFNLLAEYGWKDLTLSKLEKSEARGFEEVLNAASSQDSDVMESILGNPFDNEVRDRMRSSAEMAAKALASRRYYADMMGCV